MRNLTMTMVCLVMALNTTFAQVKRTFKDNTFAQTTVVIKEDLATDQDVLNDQFDLEEFGMDQQIRITTEDEPIALKLNDQSASTPSKTSTSIAEKPAAKPVATVASTQDQQPKRAVQARWAVKRAAKSPAKTSQATQVKTRPRSKRVERTAPLTGAFRGERSSKLSNKRVRLKKRKRVKRQKRSRCFKF